jgi:hypothetical protein
MVGKVMIRDYYLAFHAAWDAGDASMRAGGRRTWNEEDYQVAVEMFNWLIPDEELAHV